MSAASTSAGLLLDLVRRSERRRQLADLGASAINRRQFADMVLTSA